MTQARTARDQLERLGDLVRRTLRFYRVFLITVVMGGLIAVGIAFALPRTYHSETLMLYREGIRSDLGGEERSADPARKLGMKLKEMVLSRTSLRLIIDEFKLYPQIVDDRGYVDAVDEMRNHIAFRIRDGDTFGLSFEGNEPKLVQAVTTKLASALIEENSRNRVEQATVTKEFLDAEKRRNETDLKLKETELAQFLAKHPEFARETLQSAGTAIRANDNRKQTRAVADPTLNALERQAQRLDERLAAASGRKPAAKRTEQDPRLVAARNQADAEVASAQKDLADKLAQFTEQHPDVRAAKARLKVAEAKLQRAEDSLKYGEPIVVESAGSGEEEAPVDKAQLEADLSKIKAEIASYKSKKKKDEQPTAAAPRTDPASWIVALETEWTRLNREVGEARTRMKSVEDKQFLATMAAESASNRQNAQMIIVDPAYLPTHPAKAGRTVVVGVGVALACVLGFLFAVFAALIDDRLWNARDLRRIDTELVSVIPPPTRKQKNERAARSGAAVG